jgi:hypothetical protein
MSTVPGLDARDRVKVDQAKDGQEDPAEHDGDPLSDLAPLGVVVLVDGPGADFLLAGVARNGRNRAHWNFRNPGAGWLRGGYHSQSLFQSFQRTK